MQQNDEDDTSLLNEAKGSNEEQTLDMPKVVSEMFSYPSLILDEVLEETCFEAFLRQANKAACLEEVRH